MERKEFLKMLGISTASGLATVCLASCGKTSTNGNYEGPANVNFTLDLSATANAALANTGGYLYSNGVIVAKTTAGTYIAVSEACTHLGVSVTYRGPAQQFYCPSHGATFTDSGVVTNGPATTPLTQYHTALTGTMLRVYS